MKQLVVDVLFVILMSVAFGVWQHSAAAAFFLLFATEVVVQFFGRR